MADRFRVVRGRGRPPGGPQLYGAAMSGGDGTARQPGWDASRLPYGKAYAGLGLAVCEQTAGRPLRFRSLYMTPDDQQQALRASLDRRGLEQGKMAGWNAANQTS